MASTEFAGEAGSGAQRRASNLRITVPADSAAVSWEVELQGGESTLVEPKSPVQRRLEKRNRSPAGGMARSPDSTTFLPTSETSPILLAKKRREEMLEAHALENARHVARAKEIARKTSQDREREAAELATQIEDKLRAAEERRIEILAERRTRAAPKSPSTRSERSRSTLIEDVEARIAEAKERRECEFERRMDQVRQHLGRVRARCDQARMVRRLQGWWRLATNKRKVAVSFTRNGAGQALHAVFRPTLEATQPSFDDLAEHLGNPDVIAAARQFLDGLKLRRARSPRAATSVSAARSFLAMLMIVFHPETVLGSHSDSSHREALRARLDRAARNLHDVGRKLLACLDEAQGRCGSKWALWGRLVHVVRLTRSAHLVYARAFLTWKQVDAICLAEELLEAYAQISDNHSELQDMLSQGAQAEHDPGLQQHLAGNADQLASLRSRAQKLLSASQFAEWVERAEAAARRRRETTEQQERDSAAASAPSPSRATSPVQLPAQPASLVTVPSNEQMVHELMLDPAYQLSASELVANLERQTLDAKRLSTDLIEGRFDLLLALADAVRTRLGALTPNRADLLRELNGRLDSDLLRQQLQAGAFGVDELYDLVQYVGEKILALQAPARQSQTEAWLVELHVQASSKGARWEHLAPGAFDQILRELSFIDLDMANFHLRVLASHLEGDSGVEYLRGRFESRLAKGEYQRGPRSGMPAKTESWLTAAFESVVGNAASASARLELDGSGAGAVSAPVLQDVLVEGFVQVLAATRVASVAEMCSHLPETLREFDGLRLYRLNGKLSALCTLAVLNVIMGQVVRATEKLALRADDVALKEAQQKLFDLVQPDAEAEDQAPRTFLDVADSVVAVTDELTRAARGEPLSAEGRAMLDALLRQAEGALSGTVRRQLEGIMRKALRSPGYDYDQLLKKVSLDPWKRAVDAVLCDARKLYQLNVQVHEALYVTLYTDIRAG